jgi:coiled-coil domain-containing protein 63/114
MDEYEQMNSLLNYIENKNSNCSTLYSNKKVGNSLYSKTKLEELDEEIQNIQKKILSQKQHLSQIKKSEDFESRKIKTLEKSLEKAVARYNVSISKNKEIKDNINTIRRQTKINKELYKQAALSVSQSQKKMENMIDQGSKTIEHISTFENMRKALENQTELETKEYTKNLKNLENLIQREKKAETSLMTSNHPLNTSRPTEEELKMKIVSLSWKIAKEKASMVVSLNKLEGFEEIRKKFQDLTGISDFESMLKYYQDTKSHNLILSDYLITLNNEIEVLEAQLKDLKSKINYCNLEGTTQKSAVKQNLILKKNSVQKTNDFYESFPDLVKKIDDICNDIGCIHSEENLEVNENEKLMSKIACIEKRTYELLEIYGHFSKPTVNNTKNDRKLDVEIPQFQDLEEDDDMLPLTWNELMTKAEKKSKNPKPKEKTSTKDCPAKLASLTLNN